jgi:hypothetical protein
MAITPETLTFALSLLALGGALWKIFNTLSGMRDELRTEIRNVRESLERKDIMLEALQDRTNLTVNQLQEKINHSATRLRAEIKELAATVASIEGFLIKTSDYRERDYGSSRGTPRS